MLAPISCPQCGSPVAESARQGACPHCLPSHSDTTSDALRKPTLLPDARQAMHERAVRASLSWADDAAAAQDYPGALEWLVALEAIGEHLSDESLAKRDTWTLALNSAAL
jgi:hypothetical protein